MMPLHNTFTTQHRLILALLLLLVLWMGYTQQIITTAQEVATVDDCDEIEYLMAHNKTPYDYTINGGQLTVEPADNNEVALESELTASEWADYWVFQTGGTNGLTLALTIDTDIQLEVALFYGAVYVAEATHTADIGYLPITSAATLTFDNLESGIYTIVVRRPHIADSANVGTYRLSGRIGNAILRRAGEKSDTDVNTFFPAIADPATVILGGGRARVRFNIGAEAYINVGGVQVFNNTISTFNINQNGVIYQLDSSARTHFSGGGIGSHWQGNEGASTIYIERYLYGAQGTSTPAQFDTIGNLLKTDWHNIEGIWILDGCFGFKLRDIGGRGNTFIAPLQAGSERAFSINTDFSGTYASSLNDTLMKDSNRCRQFGIVLKAPDDTDTTTTHSICLDWGGIEQGASVTLINSVLQVPLVGTRCIAIQSTYIKTFERNFLRRDPNFKNDTPDEYGFIGSISDEPGAKPSTRYAPSNTDEIINEPLTVIFNAIENQAVTVVLDWINLDSFTYTTPDVTDTACADESEVVLTDTESAESEADGCAASERCIKLKFSETDPMRDTTRRNGDDLEKFEALDNIIHILYGAGQENLLLPASESYVEIITPAGETPLFNGAEFDATAAPGERGFAPRFANNLGNECYAYPTLHPEANCAENGYPNLTNGNLWYSVTDHSANGQRLNLTLTRNYNSLDAANSLDSPFGIGWSTEFMLDYNIAYDAATNARTVASVAAPESDDSVVEFAAVDSYRVGLNLIWAPRGMIVYNAPSGSRHIFVQQENRTGGFYRSLTMPGWVLFRGNIRHGWTLYQDDGMQISFDRAGRMQSYGYSSENRVVQINYVARFTDLLDGPGGYGATNFVRITDSIEQRQLELYYNEHHHIYRSVLRDMIARPDYRPACDLTDNCYETLYKYDEQHRLIEVIYPNKQTANYVYDASHLLIEVHDPRSPIATDVSYRYAANQAIEVLAGSQQTRIFSVDYNSNVTTVTDEYGNERTYTFTRSNNDTAWDTNGSDFRLEEIALGDGDDNTITYTWQLTNGYYAVASIGFKFDAAVIRTIRYEYDRIGGNIGNDQMLVRITDNDILRYEALRADYTAVTGAHHYARPTAITYADGASMQIFYNTPTRDVFPPISQVNFSDGQIWAFDRYTDDKQRNWISVAQRYYVSDGSYASDLLQNYNYNSVGLVTRYTQQRLSDASTERYIIAQGYDGLGQVVEMVDSNDSHYFIAHNIRECARTTICREVSITDTMGGVTTYTFDGRNRLIEVRFNEGDSDEFLRKTTYVYDERDRLSTEIRYAANVDCEANSSSSDCIITSYDYVSNPDTSLCTPIGETPAYRIIRTNAEKQTRIVDYNAFGQVVCLMDESALRTTYDYVYSAGKTTVTETQHYPSQPLITEYEIDGAQRLSKISYGDAPYELVWNFRNLSGFNRLRSLTINETSPSEAVGNWVWNWSTENPEFPLNLSLSTQAANVFVDATDTINFNLSDNRLGDPAYLSVPTANSTTEGVQITRCIEPRGAVKVIYHRRRGTSSVPTACDVTAGVDAINYYDVYGRLTAITDEFGTRSFAYNASTLEDYRWHVTMDAVSSDNLLQTQWTMVYNLAGDLLQWTDDTGVTRYYEYDLLGRLTAVSTNDENDETTVHFAYNRLDMLTSQTGDLGQGYHYSYDFENEAGRLVRRTANATGEIIAYTYNSDGQLESLEVKMATADTPYESFAYTYDSNNPTLLTSVTDGAGRNHQFEWVNSAQADNSGHRGSRLIYTNPLGERITYRFSLSGQLVQVAQGNNEYQWRYNSAGLVEQFIPPSQNAYVLEYAPSYDTHNLVLFAVRSGIDETSRYIWREAITRTPTGMFGGRENIGRLEPAYDALGRLHALTVLSQQSEPQYQWIINRNNNLASLQYEITDFAAAANANTVIELGFDPLYRLRTMTEQGDEARQYRYITPFSQNEARGSRMDISTVAGDAMRSYRQTCDSTREQHNPLTASCVEYIAAGFKRIFSYDVHDRLIQMETTLCPAQSALGCDTDANTAVITFTYEQSSENGTSVFTTTVTYNDGTIETFSYDAIDRLTAYGIQYADRTLTYTYTYDALSRLNSITAPNDTQVWYLYTNNGLSLTLCQTAPQDFAPTNNECEEEGRILADYTFDALGRLVQHNTRGYDRPEYRAGVTDTNAIGGIKSESTTYTYGSLGRLAAIENSAVGSGTAYTYTNDGLNLPDTVTVRNCANTETCVYTYSYEANPVFDPTNPLRLTSMIVNDEPESAGSIGYTYANGRIDRMKAGEHTFKFEYGIHDLTITDIDNAALTITVPYYDTLATPTFGIADAEYSAEEQTYTLTRPYGDFMVITIYDRNLLPLSTEMSSGGAVVYRSDWDYLPQSQLLKTETRTYPDGVSVTIGYEYVSGSTPTDFMASSLPLAAQTLTFAPALEPSEIDENNEPIDPNSHRLHYRYDNAGNLIEIIYYGHWVGTVSTAGNRERKTLHEQSCMKFTYDGANRLTEVQDGNGNALASYRYDGFNRIVSFDSGEQFVYVSDDMQPTFMYDAQEKGRLLRDQDIANTYAIDGLGRTIPLTSSIAPVNNVDDPCQIGTTMNAPLPASGMLFDAMIFDERTGLAFAGGRAYLPAIGRFLQRNSGGIDATGNSYSYPAQSFTPPIPQPGNPLDDGLVALQATIAANPAYNPLIASAIAEQYLPALPGVEDGILHTITIPSVAFNTTVQTMLNFPAWVAQSYNQPGVQVNIATGLISWDNRIVVGQHGDAWTPFYDADSAFWSNERELNTAIQMPATDFEQLLQSTATGYEAPSLYHSQLWNASFTQFDDIWTLPSVAVDDDDLPGSVVSILIEPWQHLERNIHIMNMTEQMTQQYRWTGETWLVVTLLSNLPVLPQDPNDFVQNWNNSK